MSAHRFPLFEPQTPDAALKAGVQQGQVEGLPALELRSADGSSAVVLLQGAQVVSWLTPDGKEQLYLSPECGFEPGQAVRGGVPVIFPQFNARGPLPRHGLARTATWTLDAQHVVGDDALLVMRWASDESTRAVWPHEFVLELTVRIGGERLDLELDCLNQGDEPLSFTGALHTYLRVTDVEAAHLQGLQRLRYENAATGGDRLETADEVEISEACDRIYFHARKPLLLTDGQGPRAIEQAGFEDVVLWNPWEEGAKALADLPDEDFRRFLCVEAACIGEPVVVQPEESWTGRQSIVRVR